MKSKILQMFLALSFFVSFATYAREQVIQDERPLGEGTWVLYEVGSPYYNLVHENEDKNGTKFVPLEGFHTFEDALLHAKLDEAILRVEKDYGLVTGERFLLNLKTAEVRTVPTETKVITWLPNYVWEQLKESGLLVIDVAKDTILVIPLDVWNDCWKAVLPGDVGENTMLEVVQNVAKNVAMDLRSATGFTPKRINDHLGLGESGVSKIVLSLVRIDPAGVARGSWGVVIGSVDAGEDVVLGTARITQNVISRTVIHTVKLVDKSLNFIFSLVEKKR